MGRFLCSTVATQFSHLHFLLEELFFFILCFDPLSFATVQLGIDQAERFQSISQKKPVVPKWMSE